MTAPSAFAERLRAALDPLDIEVSDDELPLIQLLHDVMTPGYAVLLSADVTRFPHEPVDPTRAPSPR